MEYSKEDLMEAKKQIWGVGENMGTEESKKIWEENAQFWDNAMGDESNEFHREVVRPKVTELLSPNPADYILDIACGNGNYSSYLAQRGASVVAFDYSKKMIELAKRRQSQYAKQIEICLSNPQKPLIFQGFTPVFHSNLICLPLFLPLRAKTRATFYSPPTTLSSSLAEVRFASLVE